MNGILYGIGVGPGDPELITLKARRLLNECDVIVFPVPNNEKKTSLARSIAAPWLRSDHLEIPVVIPMKNDRSHACQAYDRAAMEIASHLDNQRDVAVLCEGDPFFYGTFMYLFERLSRYHTTRIVPGVSSLMASAAALGRPIAARNDSLCIIPAPSSDEVIMQRLETGEAIALIKTGRHFGRVRRLIAKAGLTHSAVYIERVGLEGEKIIPLKEMQDEKVAYFSIILIYKGGKDWIKKLALTSTGGNIRTIEKPDKMDSPSERRSSFGKIHTRTPHIILLNDASFPLAKKLSVITDGIIEGTQKRSKYVSATFEDVGIRLRELFRNRQPVIAFMAAGAVIRLLAPILGDKRNEPPVIVVSHDGRQVVPLLGGHRGANILARKIAVALNANAAITTAGDSCFNISLDEPEEGYILANPEDARSVMGELLAGASAKLSGRSQWLENSDISFNHSASVKLTISERPVKVSSMELIYYPQTLVLGMGCERGASVEEAIALAEKVLEKTGMARQCVAAICSIDVKADEMAIHGVAGYFGVDAWFFDAASLEHQTSRLKNPSDIVFLEVGCHGVAEGAALSAVGEDGELIIEKMKSARVTCALAKAEKPFTNSILEQEKYARRRGKIFIVGIGPGAEEWRCPQTSAMIRASTDLVGYSLYLDLISDISHGKALHKFDLGQEEERVRHAMELAGQGKTVSLVCSGDAGIYGMATLVFELLDSGRINASARRIAIETSPGISALQAAAARAGAPLGHDFCAISLSDLLTPWEDIQKRIQVAAQGDFVTAFYNPVSGRRRTQLAFARDKLLEYRSPDTPVILAANLGRTKEKVRVVELGQLKIDDVDMLTTVLVGSSQTRKVKTGDGQVWVYTPRGYSAKQCDNVKEKASFS